MGGKEGNNHFYDWFPGLRNDIRQAMIQIGHDADILRDTKPVEDRMFTEGRDVLGKAVRRLVVGNQVYECDGFGRIDRYVGKIRGNQEEK